MIDKHYIRTFGLGLALACSVPFVAQASTDQTARAYNLSKAERIALAPMQKALDAHDWAKATAALPTAERDARGADAMYFLGQLQLQLGIGTKDEAMQARAVDTLLASKAYEASELPELYRNQGALALRKNPPDRAKAAAAFEKLVELSPADAEAKVSLAKLRNEMGKPLQALDLMVRAINAEQAAKHDIDQSWYLYALKIAYENHAGPDAVRLSQDVYSAFPTRDNWRNSLVVYRELGKLDAAALLDVLRLQRATGALSSERDWYDFASAAQAAGFPGEARAALDEGLKNHALDPAKPAFAKLISAVDAGVQSDRGALAAKDTQAAAAPTGVEALRVGDAYFGSGDYAKAIPAYRVAQSKPGVDAARVKLHLGVALTMSGDRVQGESMLRSVAVGSYGPTAEIAVRWLTWLRLVR
jgi:hypothetical protein